MFLIIVRLIENNLGRGGGGPTNCSGDPDSMELITPTAHYKGQSEYNLHVTHIDVSCKITLILFFYSKRHKSHIVYTRIPAELNILVSVFVCFFFYVFF